MTSRRVKEVSPSDTMSEQQLQDAIIELAHVLHFRVAHFRPAQTLRGWRTPVSADGKGFPDLVLVKAGRHVYIECKSEDGKLSQEQLDWEASIRMTGKAEYYLFRPSDWLNDNVLRVLNGVAEQA